MKTKAQFFWTIIGEKQYFLGEEEAKYNTFEGYSLYSKNGIIDNVKSVDQK